jgi:hypothetical protein
VRLPFRIAQVVPGLAIPVFRASQNFSRMLEISVIRSAQVTTRRTLRRTSIKVQLRINHMDVCCGPPSAYSPTRY